MMASDKDILGKADALLRRHAPAPGADPSGVPVLTDLIDDPSNDANASDISREVFDLVMPQVEARLAMDLEKRLAAQLTPQIHAAVAAAVAELRQELAGTIGSAVAAALERRNVK